VLPASRSLRHRPADHADSPRRRASFTGIRSEPARGPGPNGPDQRRTRPMESKLNC